MALASNGAAGLKSGLQVGEFANPFSVRAVTGPYRGKTLCYRCKLGTSPVVCIFARRITGALTGLLKQLDARLAHEHDLKALVVLLTDDPDRTAARLTDLARECQLQYVPLTLVANPSGPQDYKLAEEAEVTILSWKGPKVRSNRAYAAGQMAEADASALLSELHKIFKD